MQDWVRRELDALDDLFPLERLQQSKARIENLWQGKPVIDRPPFTYCYALFNMYNALHDPQERLRQSLREFRIHGMLGDDFIPALFPGCRTSTIPNMFGAQEIVVGDDVSAKRILWTAKDVDALGEPSIGAGTIARQWLRMQEYFLEATEGRLPVHVTDMQGPMDVAGQLMSYDDLFILAYTDPDCYHRLLQKITAAFILFWKAQRDLLGDLFVGTHLFGHNWVAPDFGASISADSLVMVGPDFYREFFQPYIEMIGDEFGSVSVHSCGNFAVNVQPLCQTNHVRGINAAQMSVMELLDAGLSSDTVLIALSDCGDLHTVGTVIREHGLLVDLGVSGMPWPCTDDGSVVDPELWRKEDWMALERTQDHVLAALEGDRR